jgi:hypothetical protein
MRPDQRAAFVVCGVGMPSPWRNPAPLGEKIGDGAKQTAVDREADQAVVALELTGVVKDRVN